MGTYKQITMIHLIGFLLLVPVALAQSSSTEIASNQPSWLSISGNALTGWIEAFFGMLSGRIYGGSTQTNEQRPYMAYVAYHPIAQFRTKFKIAICSASILTKKKILTGASCFSLLQGDQSVYVGASRTNNKFKKGVGTQHEIETKTFYNFNNTEYKFDTNPFLHDLAIVTLKSEMTFSSTVGAIALPGIAENVAASTTNYGGKTVTIVGYGLDTDISTQLSNSSNSSDPKQVLKALKVQELKSANQNGLTDDDCGKELGAYLSSQVNFTTITIGPGLVLTKDNITSELGKQICPELVMMKGSDAGPCLLGDNGGPIIFENKVVGVLSLVLACSNSTVASVGNELSGAHLAWVRQNGS